MFIFRTVFATLFSGALLLGCGGGGGGGGLGGGSCGSLNAKVFNGEECNQFARSPVVAMIAYKDVGTGIVPRGVCTGTLVTVDDILTSGHCFLDQEADGWLVFVGGAGGEAIPVVRANFHPSYTGAVGSPYDLAMATIARVPSPAIGPVPVLISQWTEVGQTVSVYGYGTNNRGEVGTLKSATLVIDAFEGGNFLSTIQNSGASICQGDSGGPVIQVVDGVASLVGVNSFGDALSDVQCSQSGAQLSGFVDIQNPSILEFIRGYAPDIAFN